MDKELAKHILQREVTRVYNGYLANAFVTDAPKYEVRGMLSLALAAGDKEMKDLAIKLMNQMDSLDRKAA